MFKKIVNIVLLTLVCTGILHSQINLHSFMSRAVRQGRRTGTHIDSLVLNTKVNAGSAQTRITIVAQPLGGILNKTTMKPTPLDSVEMTLNFSIPSDFVADSMWLWVDGKPVEAYIQDRALASSQYNQIVGTRRDPALLQYSGNGMYNLRIFPAESYKSRKIAIQFHHTFDDNIAGGISTSIPVVFDSTYCLYKNKYESIPRQIDCITAMFSTPDQYSYKIVLPGVGSGTFSNAQSLSLSCRNVVDLKQGTIIGNDPSGVNKFLWLSRDKIKGKTIAGVTVTLADSNVIFEDEPKMRIIALDIRNKIWNWNEYYKARAEHLGQNYNANPRFQDFNILLRAQKYAVLCLRHYLDGAKEFNIVIGGKSVQTLFDKPVPAKAESIKLALEAIQEMTPDGFSSTSQVMDAACSQANEGIVILISDLFEPYNYFEPNNPKRYSLSSTGIEYNNMLDYIDNLVDSTGIVLFTIDDNYRLSGISFNSGGYRIGRLLDRYYIDYRYEVINGKRITIPMMPPLFGSRNNSGIRKLDVTSENLTDIVYTKDGYTYNYWYSRSAVTEDVVENDLDRPFTVPDPYYRPYNPKSTILRIAGVSGTLQPREVAFNITGRLGGLKFRKNFIASTSLNATTLYGEVQWAFRKSESLAQENYSGNVLTIKAIGKQYHIITRQTSLL
ncbi:MAG: VIT domain-containing protein, partial [Chitinispirillia bacterium]